MQKTIPNLKYHIEKIPFLYSILGDDKFQKPSGLEYNSLPLVLLGCSFAYGEGLKYEDIFSVKLSKYAKRPVYNYSQKGKGLQTALFLLEKDIIEPKNPEYFIYLFMDDHIRRMYSSCSISDYVGYPIYSLDSDGYMKLRSDYFPVYRQFYTFYYWNNVFFQKKLKQDLDKNKMLLSAYFKTLNKLIKEKYPDSKLIVLTFSNQAFLKSDFANLESDGIKIINSNVITGIDLTDSKYWQSETDTHPVAEVWEILAPAFIRELNLN